MSVLSRIKKILANFRNHGAKRSTSKIKFIVIHYTANEAIQIQEMQTILRKM